MIYPPDEMKAGLERIGASRDARYLRQRLMQVLVATAGPGISDGALRHEEGRRNLAAELIEAIGLNRESGDDGRTDDGSEHVRRAGGQSIRPGAGGIGRRVPPPTDD